MVMHFVLRLHSQYWIHLIFIQGTRARFSCYPRRWPIYPYLQVKPYNNVNIPTLNPRVCMGVHGWWIRVSILIVIPQNLLIGHKACVLSLNHIQAKILLLSIKSLLIAAISPFRGNNNLINSSCIVVRGVDDDVHGLAISSFSVHPLGFFIQPCPRPPGA